MKSGYQGIKVVLTFQIRAENVKSCAIVLDIGINQIIDDRGQTQVVGDCDFESCIQTVDWITPVPGGVGPVIVSNLMQNTVVAAKRLKAQYNLDRV